MLSSSRIFQKGTVTLPLILPYKKLLVTANLFDMRNSLILFFLFSVSLTATAQVKDPVKWSFTSKKISTGNYEIHLTAAIESGWHIYSQSTPDGGPVATAFTFNKNPLASKDDKTKEVGKLETHFEKLFDVEVKQYSKKVDFVQKFKVKGAVKTAVTGTVEFMVCNDKECLPPKKLNFSISIN